MRRQNREIPHYATQMDNFFEREHRLYSTRSLTFQVTEDCTLNCTYCYQKMKRKNSMTFDIAKRTIDMLFDNVLGVADYFPINDIPAIILEFIGGEPFLEINLIDEILDYWVLCAEKHHSVLSYRFMASFSTNGTLYFTDSVQRFLEKWKGKVSVSFSIDGNKELHDSCRLFPDGSGSYDIAMKACKDYTSKYRTYRVTKMTLCPQNINFTSDAIINLIENNFDNVAFNCVFEEGWNSSHAKILYNECKKISDYIIKNNILFRTNFFDDICGNNDYVPEGNFCGGTGSMLAVDWQGKFYPCIRYMENALNGDQKPYSIGDITTGIAQTPLDCSRCKLLNSITRKSQSKVECLNCPVQSGCGWCSAYNYQIFGTPNKRATFICDMHKARVLANAYYWNSLILADQYSGDYFKINLPKEDALKYISDEEWALLKGLEQKAKDKINK